MSELGIYCNCGVRLDVMALDKQVRTAIPAKAGTSPGARAALASDAAGQPFDLQAANAADGATRQATRRQSPDFPHHRRWAWDCGKCGHHQEANNERIVAALERGRRRLDFGADL